jgi:hypothetical protein
MDISRTRRVDCRCSQCLLYRDSKKLFRLALAQALGRCRGQGCDEVSMAICKGRRGGQLIGGRGSLRAATWCGHCGGGLPRPSPGRAPVPAAACGEDRRRRLFPLTTRGRARHEGGGVDGRAEAPGALAYLARHRLLWWSSCGTRLVFV